MIRDGNGNVVAGGIIPDDDNTYTIAKGGLDPQACVDNGDGTWDLGFTLGQSSTGALTDFVFEDTVGAGDICGLTPLSSSNDTGTFSVAYARKL